MKNMGLKRTLLLSVILLVAISVALANFASYYEQKTSLTKSIMAQSNSFVLEQAAMISSYINEKVGGVSKIAQQYKNQQMSGSADQLIDQTKFLANALNLESAVLAFDNGDAYWNIATDNWPNHKFNGDVTQRPWYQAAQRASGVTVTDPYKGTDGANWVTIIEKMQGGTVSADMTLSFLNDMVKTAIPGAVAVIMNENTTLLASSSTVIKGGDKGTDYPWFKEAALNAVGKDKAVFEYNLNGQDKILFSHIIHAGDKKWYYAIGLDKSVAFAQLEDARTNAILVTVVATILCVLIAFVLINFLYRPIISLRDTIANLSSGNGDLTQRLTVTSNDDIGQISQGVNRFIEDLQNMMLEVKQASGSL